MIISQVFEALASSMPHAWPLLLLTVLIARLLYVRFSAGLNKIPGPFLQSISQIPRALQVWSGRIHQYDMALHARYGSIVRVGPKLLSLSDVSEVTHVYGITTEFYKVRHLTLPTTLHTLL